MADAAAPVWSTAWFLAVARLAAVGVCTGALTGAALVLLLVTLGRGSLVDAGAASLFGLMAGAAFALPVVLLCVVTGLVVAARAPQRRAVTLALMLVWPTALTALVVWFFASNEGHAPGPWLLGAAVLLAGVAASVVTTFRWVTAPLR